MRFNKLLIAMVLALIGWPSIGRAQQVAPDLYVNFKKGHTVIDNRMENREAYGIPYTRQYISSWRYLSMDGRIEVFEFPTRGNEIYLNSDGSCRFQMSAVYSTQSKIIDGYQHNCVGHLFYVAPGGEKYGDNFILMHSQGKDGEMGQGYNSDYGYFTIAGGGWTGGGGPHNGPWRAVYDFYPTEKFIKAVRETGNVFRFRLVALFDDQENVPYNRGGAVSLKGLERTGRWGDWVSVYTTECKLIPNEPSAYPTFQMMPDGHLQFFFDKVIADPSKGKIPDQMLSVRLVGQRNHCASVKIPSRVGGTNLLKTDVYKPVDIEDIYYNHKKTFRIRHHGENIMVDVPCVIPNAKHRGGMVKGLPRAQVTTTFDQWKKQVVLNWKITNVSDQSKFHLVGKWFVWRKLKHEKDFQFVKSYSYSTRKHIEDTQTLEYDKEYVYRVAFCPDYCNEVEWQSRGNDCVVPDITVSTQRRYTVSAPKTTNGDKTITVEWTNAGLPNVDPQSVYFQMERKVDDGKWTNLGERILPKSEAFSVKYVDAAVEANSTYHYRFVLHAMSRTFESDSKSGTLLTSFRAKDLEVSTGSYDGVVKLKWNVVHQGTQMDLFKIYRKTVLGSEDSWMQIGELKGVADSYFYDDNTVQPGTYYHYRVDAFQKNHKTQAYGVAQSTNAVVGFAQTSGVISGRVSYGTGTAVKGVRVNLYKDVKEGAEDEFAQFYSMQVMGPGDHLRWNPGQSFFQNNVNIEKGFTVQLYTRILPQTNKAVLFASGNVALLVEKNAQGNYQLKHGTKNGIVDFPGAIILGGDQDDKWVHLTYVHQGKGLAPMLYLRTITRNENFVGEAAQTFDTGADLSKNFIMDFGDGEDDNKDVNKGIDRYANTGLFGYLDEIRIWNKALSEEEDRQSFDRILSGTEPGLKLYWPLDEGFKYVFDVSQTGGVPNSHHTMMLNGISVTEKPADEQLGLYGLTDASGNYIVSGVPFSGRGINYTIVPSMGIHKFTPEHSARYVSADQLNHSGVDFEDRSSFPVRGTVRYANTDYPVEGATLYVDGQLAQINGNPVFTDQNGEYLISVPIGDHYVSIQKDGHIFSANGRFPEDTGVGTLWTFEKEMSGLNFYDETLTELAGRIVGGEIEGQKTLGFGLSENNLGQVELVLQPKSDYRLNVVKKVDGTTISWETNPEELAVSASTSYIHSSAQRGGGVNSNKIYIQTDPKTGEFYAKIPPIPYKLNSVKLKKTGDVLVHDVDLDASNVLLGVTDSLNSKVFKRNLDYRYTHHVAPIFTVTQVGNEEGAYGEKDFWYCELNPTDNKVDSTLVPLYTCDPKTKQVNYLYNNAAVFLSENRYTFKMKGYEEFVNVDKDKDAKCRVPLAGAVVTVANALSADQSVIVQNNSGEGSLNAGDVYELKSNQCILDSLGEFTYSWEAGLPNVTSPYTRTIEISYNVAGKPYKWTEKPLNGAIFGKLSTGNNFVTAGTDKLTYILRDPSGSNSSATWAKGSSVSSSTSSSWAHFMENEIQTVTSLGFSETFLTGTAGGGFMLGKLVTVESRNDIVAGISSSYEREGGTEISEVTTTSQEISTSDDEDYVGADGDIFVGTSTNLIFGKANEVTLLPAAAGGYELGVRKATNISMKFATDFVYTQKHIKEVLIPNFKKIRNELLQYKTEDEINGFVNNTDEPIYLTSMSNKDDESFGQSGHYKMFVPKNGKTYTDTINWFNLQIAAWEKFLAFNEQTKVETFQKGEKYLKVNHSFDAGSSITGSVEVEKEKVTSVSWTSGASVMGGFGHDGEIFGQSISVDLTSNIGGGGGQGSSDGTGSSSSISYTLADGGVNDALTVDVYNAPDGFGPIFRTRGGQTSAPYEGEVRTEYYKPNEYVINEGTMQIEVPQLQLGEGSSSIVTDVPSGRPANYTLVLNNASETADECTYKLYVDESSNPMGARVTVDGEELTAAGRLFKVAFNKALTKNIQIWQTKNSDRSFEDIKVVLSSVTDEDIADSVKLSANYVPSSSDVTLEISTLTMNNVVEKGSTLVAVMKDFDRQYENFKSLTLQYRYESDPSWTEMKKYVLKDDNQHEVIPASGNIKVEIPMAAYPDGKYTFRVISAASYGLNSEVFAYSNEVEVIKDMQQPQLLGNANPADGILSVGDNINVRFNEDIRKGSLTKDRNFRVFGVRNDAKIDHKVALRLSGAKLPAATELPVNLSGKDFTIDMWVNYHTAGTLFAHGTKLNGFSVEVDSEGHLIFYMGGQRHVSQAAFKADKWVFLTLNYKQTAGFGMVNALVAQDAEEIELFVKQSVPAYTGNGRVVLGSNLNGAIHEVALWNVARDCKLSLSNRNQGKSPVTPFLVGYWKLNEGHGTVAADAAEARHLILNSENWYLNNENFALALDGSQHLALNTSAVSPLSSESYAVEFWFNPAKDATYPATLMQSGNQKLSIGIDADGYLTMNAEDRQLTTTSSPKKGVWNHCLLNVSRGGSAILYLNGDNVKTVPEAYVPALAGDNLVFGAQRVYSDKTNFTTKEGFKGALDEIRLWNGQFTGKYLNNQRFERMDTLFAAGLVAYCPMEGKYIGDGDQVIEGFNVADASLNHAMNGTAKFLKGMSPVNLVQAASTPSLKSAPSKTNLEYTFTASDREIFIQMNETPDRLEGTTVEITLQDVYDLNGNPSAPITWSAYVRQNGLLWASDNVVLDTESGVGASFKATIVNKSGVTENWSLDNLPSWLSVDQKSGVLSAASQQELNFTISPALAVGNHDETLLLVGNNGISESLGLRVNVRSELPDWKVDPSQYNFVAVMVSQVFIDNKVCENPETRVAAFINGTCNGLAQLEYVPSRDAYYVFMNIYGSEKESQHPITFKIWDASTGIIYSQVVVDDQPEKVLNFVDNDEFGTIEKPIKLANASIIEQVMDLHKGWNWVSFYVNSEQTALEALRASGKLLMVTDSKQFADTEGGGLQQLLGDKLYKVNMVSDATVLVTGEEAPNQQPIQKGYNWIGGSHMINLPLQDAFTSVAKENDLVKNMYGFAIYNGNIWEGSLKVIEPGKGYIYKSMSETPVTLQYPKSISYGSRKGLMSLRNKKSVEHFTGLTSVEDQFKNNMTMVACVTRGGELVTDAEVAVYVGAEFRTLAVTDAQGRLFLTIPGNDGDQLRFVVFADNQEYNISSASSIFTSDAHYGALSAPVNLDIDNVTGIELGSQEGTSESVYFGLDGRAFGTERKDIKRTGVYIMRDSNNISKKVLLK